MSARAQQRREVTARELAARLGSSERTARRLVAEPRDEFLSRAAAKRKMAVELREQGRTYSEIATTMGLSIGSVGKLLLLTATGTAHECVKFVRWNCG